MIEIYKDIPGYEGLYQVSKSGKVKSLYNRRHKLFREKILRQTKDSNGYIIIGLYNRTKKKCRVHRIVATVFKPNPNNYPIVLHLDNDPSNNNDWNLKWGTQQDNMKQLHNEGRTNFQTNHPSKGKFGKNHFNSKKINQYTKEGIFIKKWDSMTDVERQLGIHHGNLSSCCRGKSKTAGGFIWKFK